MSGQMSIKNLIQSYVKVKIFQVLPPSHFSIKFLLNFVFISIPNLMLYNHLVLWSLDNDLLESKAHLMHLSISPT